MDFDTILAATSNFSEGNKLGQGGFGPVYKVKITNVTMKYMFNLIKMWYTMEVDPELQASSSSLFAGKTHRWTRNRGEEVIYELFPRRFGV